MTARSACDAPDRPSDATNERFSKIYEENEWGYGSGVGSLPLNNVDYMKFIQNFIAKNGIQSVVDFGCGDWQFSRFINWGDASYIGLDIVDAVIARNQSLFGGPNRTFSVWKTGAELPDSDLIVCKDVFQHLPIDRIREYLILFKNRASFLLITNDDWPAEELTNSPIGEGGWRPVKLSAAPFFETAPIVLSWMIEWGGWKPTRKATCLVVGNR